MIGRARPWSRQPWSRPASSRQARSRPRWLTRLLVVGGILFASIGFWLGVLLAQPDGPAIEYGLIGEAIWLPLTVWWAVRSIQRRRARERALREKAARKAERRRAAAAAPARRSAPQPGGSPRLDSAAATAGRAVGRLLKSRPRPRG